MSSEDSALQPKYEYLCEIRDAMRGASSRILNNRLSAGGLDDISEDALLFLFALNINAAAAHTLMRRLGIDSQATSQSIETSILRGYLEFRDNPNNPRQPRLIVTEQGRAAFYEAEAGFKADRWAHFPLRSGDIIICTVPKSGTTWMQMICALLIFQTPTLPAALPELSPWLEDRAKDRAKRYAELDAQHHRRFIKTHVSMNELPVDPRVTYIVVARNPLDIAISWHYQQSELPGKLNPENTSGNEQPAETTREWLLARIDEMGTPPRGRDSYLDALLKNLSCAWERRAEPNVVLVHYEDLSADLAGEMRRLARRLDITVPQDKWPALVQAATFEQMQSAADQLQPLRYLWQLREVSEGHAAFFRAGSSGDGRNLLTEAETARYRTRAAQVAPQDLLAWLQRDAERLYDPRAAALLSRGRARPPQLEPTSPSPSQVDMPDHTWAS
jgi:DNA-binding MarR family transcriptional regulator